MDIGCAWSRVLSTLAPFRCAACSHALRVDAVLCAACLPGLLEPPPTPDWVSASYAYGGVLAELLRSLKFDAQVDLLRPLQRLVLERLPADVTVDVVTAVPLHRSRLLERGFDQAALLAMAVARALRRPAHLGLLRRVRPTTALATLSSAARAEAIAGAFHARAVQQRRVLIVDDVFTTGATLGAARDALRAAGASVVFAHVLAATPPRCSKGYEVGGDTERASGAPEA